MRSGVRIQDTDPGYGSGDAIQGTGAKPLPTLQSFRYKEARLFCI